MYALSCSCGKPHSVVASQAGQSITCTCGKTLEVPSLRGLRELAQDRDVPRPGAPSAAKPRAQWSTLQACLFGLGLLLLLIATPVSAYCYYIRSDINTARPVETPEDDVAYRNHLDGLTPIQLQLEWDKMSAPQFRPGYHKPFHIRAQEYAAWLEKLGLGGAIGAVTGLVLMVVSQFVGARPGSRK